MSPETPSDPQKGKVDEPTEAEATEAKAAAAEEAAAEKAEQPEAKPKRSRKKPAADTAAEETGVDKTAAAAEAEEKPKPKRSRAKKKDDEEAAEGPTAEAAAEDEGPTAEEVEAKASEEAAESQPAKKKAPKSRTEKDEPATPAPPAPKRGRKRGADNGKPAERVLVQAKARYVRTSPRKARLVCDHIRGKDVAEARAILAYTPRGAAKAWIKLLESAVANAEHNHELVGDELRIAAVYADEGPTLKRYRPRAMGRATRIRKRTSHLTIALTPKES
jgi:large subunit ribosomal protein L22